METAITAVSPELEPAKEETLTAPTHWKKPLLGVEWRSGQGESECRNGTEL